MGGISGVVIPAGDISFSGLSWMVSEHALHWTCLNRDNIKLQDDELQIRINPVKPPEENGDCHGRTLRIGATGGEVRTKSLHHYGTYRAELKASDAKHVISAFFTYRDKADSPDPSGGYENHEIDVEILKNDSGEFVVSFTTWTYYNPDQRLWKFDIDDDFYEDILPEIEGVIGQKLGINITAYSPVDLRVTNPEGLVIDKQSNEIPGASYVETDINGDGNPDDIIVIPEHKIGDYRIAVFPEPNAEPTDTYTLEVSSGGTTLVLAKDIPISDIPEQPYIIESTEKGVLPPWDINQDKVVDISDLVIVGLHFGETISPNAQPNPDVNRDGTVDILDLVLVGLHFGENYGAVAAPSLAFN